MPFLLVANPGARSSDDLARRAEDRLDDVRTVDLREGLDLRGEIERAERLDEGILDVRVIRTRSGMRARAGIALRLLRVRRPSRVVGTKAETVDMELAVGSHPIALDGEPDERTTTIHIQIEPRALRVLAPAGDRPPTR